MKGSIKLEKIKVVEAVEDRVLDNKVNVFQVNITIKIES